MALVFCLVSAVLGGGSGVAAAAAAAGGAGAAGDVGVRAMVEGAIHPRAAICNTRVEKDTAEESVKEKEVQHAPIRVLELPRGAESAENGGEG